MKKEISIGIQDFEKLRGYDAFYIDKTDFIREWWESGDEATIITRPRRFGKTLNMSMLNCFFSNKFEGRSDLFEGLGIWKNEKFKKLQGTYPVIFLSFAGVKGRTYEIAVKLINSLIADLYSWYYRMMNDSKFTDKDRRSFDSVERDMDDATGVMSLNMLCKWLHMYYGKKCIILLDEYDTPLQEAYLNGYWDEMTAYMRSLFNNTFKTNPYMERAVMTGITRISKESIFSDLNNLLVVTTTSEKYASSFGFTESEVFSAMDAQDIPDSEKEKVKSWYDGFTFGNITDIYNPWSITMYMKELKFGTHWANTSSNGLVGHLLRTGDPEIKEKFEDLLNGGTVKTAIDEQIVFNKLNKDSDAVWSLLLASGYLKVVNRESYSEYRRGKKILYTLQLTNFEVQVMFDEMVSEWFRENNYMNRFVKAMLTGNVLDMNRYMNDVALTTFSSFDSGSKPSSRQPENFYHGFVLGLLVENAFDYIVKSNRESGYGRYDVVMEPRDRSKPAVIMEFKVLAEDEGEKELADTVRSALAQIEEKMYDTELVKNGIPKENILKYGIAFQGKKCLIEKQKAVV